MKLSTQFPQKLAAHCQPDFTTLKKPPGKPRLVELRHIKDRRRCLIHLLDTARSLAAIPPACSAECAAEARSLEPNELARYTKADRFTVLCCFIPSRSCITRSWGKR